MSTRRGRGAVPPFRRPYRIFVVVVARKGSLSVRLTRTGCDTPWQLKVPGWDSEFPLIEPRYSFSLTNPFLQGISPTFYLKVRLILVQAHRTQGPRPPQAETHLDTVCLGSQALVNLVRVKIGIVGVTPSILMATPIHAPVTARKEAIIMDTDRSNCVIVRF